MIKDLEIILSEGEGYKVEFKKSPDKDLASEACAFANCSGGKIYLGIDDKKNIVVGTDTSNVARSNIQDTINNIQPRPRTSLEVHDDVIIVTVHEGESKPYMCAGGFYIRIGPNTQKLDRDGILGFMQSANAVRYDAQVRDDFPVNSNFIEKAYDKYIKKARIDGTLPFDRVLMHLDCAKQRADGELVYTNAGALFFRDNNDDPHFCYTKIMCVLFKGTGKSKVIDMGDYNEGMLDNIDNAVKFLWRNLRVRHELKGTQRQNVLEMPEEALREAITNAAAHRDYFKEGANIMVEVYDDRVVVTNPGGLPDGLTLDRLGSMSFVRNKTVVDMLYRAGYIEKMGTGIKKIRDSMEEAGLEAPTFESDFFFTVTFKRPQLHTLSIEKVPENVLSNLPGDLTEKEIRICEQINGDKNITVAEIMDRLGMTESTVNRALKSLTEKGVITRIGSKRVGSWRFLMSSDV
ncbi:MAG: putative DNA binding domain-containing protein [Methanomassiliicoccaceae archaeon]|nr:putative DNA binding domain-containing protein [Methanomassiliicoccaceae archaeon]